MHRAAVTVVGYAILNWRWNIKELNYFKKRTPNDYEYDGEKRAFTILEITRWRRLVIYVMQGNSLTMFSSVSARVSYQFFFWGYLAQCIEPYIDYWNYFWYQTSFSCEKKKECLQSGNKVHLCLIKLSSLLFGSCWQRSPWSQLWHYTSATACGGRLQIRGETFFLVLGFVFGSLLSFNLHYEMFC